MIAYDGSLQAARALAAFESTGLAESGKVHVITVSEHAHQVAGLAAVAFKFLSRHDVESVSHELNSSRAPADIIADQVRQLNAGLVVMGGLWPVRHARVFCGLSDPKAASTKPGAVVSVPLNDAPATALDGDFHLRLRPRASVV